MSSRSLSFVFVGLSITSSWGNGHATTYRGLLRELAKRGHKALFLERDVPWYRDNRDLPNPPYCTTELYSSFEELHDRFAASVCEADITIVGSYVPDGDKVGAWVQRTAKNLTGFYDIDTPVTLQGLATGGCAYLTPALIPGYDLYLSFTGGPTLTRIEKQYGAKRARPLYCSADPSLYYPEDASEKWGLGYLGTYSSDRQPALEALLIEPARSLAHERFVVAGPQYPDSVVWPANVERLNHVPPSEHRTFYCSQRYTLNITRRDMIAAGYSPSVRLFEAAACGTPIISDAWEGLSAFFTPDLEILVARSPADVRRVLLEVPETRRRSISRRAAARVLREHTAAHRAAQLEAYVEELIMPPSSRRRAQREETAHAAAQRPEPRSF
ncbi:MAG TPA: glycosyltransferase [Polyangiaceae bacterium]|nr:glycosyltransferase [Polyangiaceae bacterium]